MADKQAVVIGIDKYQWDCARQLTCAVHDAVEVAAAIAMPEYGFQVEKFIDEDARSETIEKAVDGLLRGMAKTKVLYFAGHGFADDKGVYLVTEDGGQSNPGLNLAWVGERVRSARPTVILIFDCCHARAGDVRRPEAYKSLTDGDLDRALGTLSEGKMLIAACAADELAYESKADAHGLFTFYLLEGLMGQAANLRGIVTPMGLYDYVATRLKEEGRQNAIWKGEVTGQVVLGAGFPAAYPLTPGEAQIDPQVISQLEREAAQHMDRYLGACLSNPDVVPERARFSVLFSFGSTITRTHS
jgi:uncharacterized caspase-like protein